MFSHSGALFTAVTFPPCARQGPKHKRPQIHHCHLLHWWQQQPTHTSCQRLQFSQRLPAPDCECGFNALQSGIRQKTLAPKRVTWFIPRLYNVRLWHTHTSMQTDILFTQTQYIQTLTHTYTHTHTYIHTHTVVPSQPTVQMLWWGVNRWLVGMRVG